MRACLNANHLKLIAIAAMTVDHAADLLYPGFPAQPAPILLHIVGRLTAPIMWFFLCEGFFHTKNFGRYLTRMFLLAFVSHFAYCFAFGIDVVPFRGGSPLNQTSVIWPLAWALVALWAIHDGGALRKWQRTGLAVASYFAAFPGDWSSIAVLAVTEMYPHRGALERQIAGMMKWVLLYAAVSFLFVSRVYGVVCLFAGLVYFPLRLYNGERGRTGWLRWLFYAYYPAHLVLVGMIRLAVYGDVPLLF